MRFPNIQLSQQGIVLVSIPLLFQVIFVLSLVTLLGQVEREAYQAEHSRNIIVETDKLVSLFYQSGTALASYDMTKNPFFKMGFEKSADNILKQLVVVRRLTDSDHTVREPMKEVDNLAGQVLNKMTAIEEKINRGESAFSAQRDSIVGVRALGDRFAAKLGEIVAKQRRIEADEPKKQAQLRYMVETCLGMGVIFNILLAVALANIFHRMTAARLKILMDNTHLLAIHQPLNPPVEGNDEIAKLDSVFRKMASALEDAARQKQQFLAMVSHDLRSPLTSALLSLDIIGSGAKGPLPSTLHKEMSQIQGSISRLVRLVNDLLDIEKLEEGKLELKPQQVNLEVIVDNSIDAVKGLADSKLVTIEHENTDLDLFVDGERISQVLINLLSNAIKYTPRKSSIHIQATKETASVLVTITDAGAGIPAQYQDMIFDRFQQMPDTKGGSGLGLAICKAIVEQHKGQIGVTSGEKGSTFWFRVPL